ncbi:iron complex transport system ATP-binding protein [Algoriphagus ratkowskyi]|uniref:ABC transporter ATP-binding protein n=1 Tax=Algoriphagus ratkowskyi TaxID=57028 RepID=A0A2W7QQ33_9BACT|nr:ABC transporter ATP-binding protein [Algoriphagus ratkowskyi]PZX50454.1 iron complex transport system ATP-binding protein [Algoriphagus ratkowskyi]TXD75734.1 ABC transporter ATP-binding protein [Algoriphagus ratkowskyi]
MEKAAVIGKNLTVGYSKQKEKKEILHDLNFALFSGEMTCLLGPNGVGKSTLVKAILGQLKPWSGSIFLNSKEIGSYANEELAKELSVVLTEPFLPGNMTVGQLVAMGRIPHTGWTGKLNVEDVKAVENALEATKITYLKDERLGEISDGQRQKAMIARALAQDGKVMVLDEPTAHLDLVNRFEIMRLLHEISRKQLKAILVVTHDLEIALETADKFWLLNCGSPLISGLPEDLVISGQINQLLPGKQFHFNVERGRIESIVPEVKFDITGPNELAQWLRKALQKAGIQALDSSIQVVGDPFSIEYLGQFYKSVGEFVESLKSKDC